MSERNDYSDGKQINDGKCLFCQNTRLLEINYTGDDTWHYNCPYCGEYKITDSALQEILADPEHDKKLNRLASLFAERMLQKRSSFLLGTYTDSQRMMFGYADLLKQYPSDFREQHDRALLNFARLANFTPLSIIDDKVNPHVLFCDSFQEMYTFLRILKDERYVNFNDQGSISAACLISDVSLTVSGFEYVRSLGKDISKRQHAFVAMWFHDEMQLYRQEVQKAIIQAGYKPYIVDQDSFNGLIMDKVLNEISEAKFVIADLTSLPETETDPCTGVRGGVYYEAGYAAGLGLQVILTCREDVTARIHFDLKQFLGIFWKETDDGKLMAWKYDFVDYLKNHIIKTVGPGPHYGKDSGMKDSE